MKQPTPPRETAIEEEFPDRRNADPSDVPSLELDGEDDDVCCADESGSAQTAAGKNGEILLQAGEADAGTRLDRFLAKESPDLSRSRLKALIESGKVLVDGEAAVRPARLLRGTESVRIILPPPKETSLVPQDLPLEVLFEDDALLVLNKAAGMVVHPGAGVESGTVVNAVMFHCPNLPGIGGELRPGIVHRLDKDTSGCLAVAKTEQALAHLQAQFQAHTTDKRYLAIVHDRHSCADALGDSGLFDTLHARHPTDRLRFTSHVTRGRQAITRWEMAERFDADASLVRVQLFTGRTHQIRMHFGEAGHPLLSDVLYGGTKREKHCPNGGAVRRAAEAIGRQALHAEFLALNHPVTGERMTFEAPIPDDFARALAILRGSV